MKIGLISPKSTFLSNNGKFASFWKESDFTQAYREEWSGISTALCIIAALTPEEHQVEIIDENVEPIDFSQKYDLVGITGMTQQATRGYEIADQWRKLSIPVVIGGIHASVMPKEAKEHADSVVIGEAENIWHILLEDLKINKLKPFYKSAEAIDLSKIPTPRYELLKDKGYSLHWIQTTRGCPFDCIFCAASKVYGYRYRTKSIDQVISELEYILNIYPNTRISFSDDNMFINRKNAKELLRRISPYNIRYMAQSDISVAEDDELLRLIKESGCTFLFIGIESISESTLDGIDKNNKKRKYLKLLPEYIKKIQSHGIGIMGAFITGLENDNPSVFDRIIAFSQEHLLYNTQVSILTPFPGTDIHKKFLEENRIMNTDWSNYTVFDVNFKHDSITKEQFEDGLLKAYKNLNSEEFYLKKLMHFKNIHRELTKKPI